MEKQLFKEVAAQVSPKPKLGVNLALAFISGGAISLLGQGLIDLYRRFGVSKDDAVIWMLITIICLAALTTGIGIYDKYAERAGGGAFIPITGFANSLTSATVDSRHEGPIYGVGANLFKYAGCVILYGVLTAYIVGLIRYGISLL